MPGSPRHRDAGRIKVITEVLFAGVVEGNISTPHSPIRYSKEIVCEITYNQCRDARYSFVSNHPSIDNSRLSKFVRQENTCRVYAPYRAVPRRKTRR